MSDFSKSENMKRISDKQLLEIIRGGRGLYMPSWEGTLNENEISDMGAYVRSLGR